MDELRPNTANSTALTPLSFLERAATVYGDCTSIVYNETTYTWSDTHARCLRMASSISKLGIKRGQVVSIVAPNTPAIYELHFSVPMAGAVLNTINTRLDARTISVLLRHGESKLLFVDYQLTSVVKKAISLFPPNVPRPLLVLITDDGVGKPPTPVPTADYMSSYEAMVENGDPRFKWIKPNSEWDPIALNYTSGTTSSPKGVVHCHRAAFVVALDSLMEWSVPKQPVYLWTLPMFHANGWSFTWAMAAVGGTNVCLRKFDATIIADAIRKNRVTHMCSAPVVLNMISEKLPNPVHIMTAGAPPAAAVLLRAESLGFVVTHAYGLTETGAASVTCAWKRKWDQLPAAERARLKARQGVRTVGMAEVDVVDPDTGLSVTRDGSTLGEIVLRGSHLMLGYLKDKEGSSKCMKDGWFYTGDVGVMHADGYLEIKDRSKDVIISGGENVSSVEVESALYSHPVVHEAAVVARPDEYWGETPCAFVSVKAATTEEEIIKFCREKLPHYMVPKTVVFQEELPKTSTGKVQKFMLREMAKALGPTAARSRM